MNLSTIIRYLTTIRNRDRIPKLPRAMLAADYDSLDRDARRVLARVGARDPAGIKLAMKRRGARTVDDLIEQLEHQRPRRAILRRIMDGLGRISRGVDHVPHQAEIVRAMRAPCPDEHISRIRMHYVRRKISER